MIASRAELEQAPTDLESFTPDVIVVGSGSAGATAARKLVDEGDIKVLLLEAGGPDVNPAIHAPARLHELWNGEEDWAFETVPQVHAASRRLAWPRGRVLGGSSCLNGMIWVRGAPADYDTWAYLGADGWSWADVRPVFERIEHRSPRDGGIVTILSEYKPDAIHEAIAAAAVECGVPFNPDYNGDAQDGIAFIQFSIDQGVRHSTAAAYLEAVRDHPNLRIAVRSRARRLMFDGTRCTGVEWERAGVPYRTEAAEVVLSAGTIGSPQILMLSGVGPADHLRSLGIEVVMDLPGVGENLHDHLLSPVIFAAEREIGPPSAGLPACQTHMFVRSRPGLTVPDVQPIHFMVPMYEPWMHGPENGFTLMAGMIRPQSRGTLRLSGSGIDDPLLLDPNLLAAKADLQSLVSGVELCRRLGAAPSLRAWGATEQYPGPDVDSQEQIEDYVRRTAITYHHQVGTCRMGLDPMAVVDPKLRVHNIDGLLVADASVMPTITTGNTNAPSIMIGERLAEFLTHA